MDIYDKVQRIIGKSDVSVIRTTDGNRVVKHNKFKPLSLRTHNDINIAIENDQKKAAQRIYGKENIRELKDVVNEARNMQPVVLNCDAGDIKTRVMDMFRQVTPSGSFSSGGISNYTNQSGVPGQDPAMDVNIGMNVWISPHEAAAIYSQKGVPEVIIRKKSQSVLLNSMRIENPKIEPKKMDTVNIETIRTGLDIKIADIVRDSLVYGGSLIFPMFKFDNPMTTGIPISVLARAGLLKKGCVSHFVSLDRHNVVHTPSYNPASKDFMNPSWFFIPFLGTDVHSSRCSRVVTAPQPGYWGQMVTYGWGLSDIVGWIESVYKYYSVMQTIPTMINQMSVLARTINVDGILATEGAAILDEIERENTVRVRQMSSNNPITLDVIGDIKAIQRDFKQVPELVRLMRQDVGAKAVLPEELIWSSERGAFASDSTDSAYEKQSEGTRYIHLDVARQLKNIAEIAVIDALGIDEEIYNALPYTKIVFDNPRITNAKDKAEIAANITKGYFDLVAAGTPKSMAMKISQDFADDEFHVSNDLLASLDERQAIDDAREEEKHNKEMELLDAQVESTRNSGKEAASLNTGAKNSSNSSDDNKKGHSYEDPLEQRKHEKIKSGSSRKLQRLQKAVSKKPSLQ